MSDREYVDFATVRDLLEQANERRGELSYEQLMALGHAQWAASENRGGKKTDPEVFKALRDALMETASLSCSMGPSRRACHTAGSKVRPGQSPVSKAVPTSSRYWTATCRRPSWRDQST